MCASLSRAVEPQQAQAEGVTQPLVAGMQRHGPCQQVRRLLHLAGALEVESQHVEDQWMLEPVCHRRSSKRRSSRKITTLGRSLDGVQRREVSLPVAPHSLSFPREEPTLKKTAGRSPPSLVARSPPA